jgi:hypothetical protein
MLFSGSAMLLGNSHERGRQIHSLEQTETALVKEAFISGPNA